ncbi:hypothetical protein [Mesorhizobium sp.]|uniref:hypothetical protein n=1 Tax=Mesorhizobium sp. TaxID=1871066 RepID=UPI0025C29A52|nr:hypothetical protein [Mesorhizobium sp.]
MKIRPTQRPASAENPSASSEASASCHRSTASKLAASDALAATHHPAASDADLLAAFSRDAALQKWTVPEAAEAAKAFWGKTAPTAIAWCAVSAHCEGRTQEFRFWFRVFSYLQAGSPDSEAEVASGKACPSPSRWTAFFLIPHQVGPRGDPVEKRDTAKGHSNRQRNGKLDKRA